LAIGAWFPEGSETGAARQRGDEAVTRWLSNRAPPDERKKKVKLLVVSAERVSATCC